MGGIAWVGLDRPAANCLMPFYCGVTGLPPCVETMNLVDFDMESAWWAFNFVANFATLKYAYMMADLQTLRTTLEEGAYAQVAAYAQSATPATVAELTAYCGDHAEKVRNAWWKLAGQLIVTYNDGCRTSAAAPMQKLDYPEPWLRKAGYYQGPTSYNRDDCRAVKPA